MALKQKLPLVVIIGLLFPVQWTIAQKGEIRAQTIITLSSGETITHTQPGIWGLRELFDRADIVALVKVLSGDTEAYEKPYHAVYKAEVIEGFKGSTKGEVLYYGPFIGTQIGWEYLLFLIKEPNPVAPKTMSNFSYGTVSYARVFNQGYTEMLVDYECIFDGETVDQRCDYGVRVCTDYILLPKTIHVFPPAAEYVPFGCRWVRKASLIPLLEELAKAEQGDADAQYTLGDEYLLDNGITKVPSENAKWYQPAAEQGNGEAQFQLGLINENDEGDTHNYPEAVKWYRMAAEQGHPGAQFNLARLYDWGEGVKINNVEAVKWYRLAAEQGHVLAQSYLGWMYYNGEGITQDYSEAVRWWRMAAERGYPRAQFNVGWIHYLGRGITQDYSEAIKWFRLAAEQGDSSALLYMGLMYKNGKGITQDYVKAYMWFNITEVTSEGIDRRDAGKMLGSIIENMTQEQIATAQRLAKEWLEKHKILETK